MNAPKIVFAGTPEFALASLTALVDAKLEPSLVLTQPDRPAGRGRKLLASPVKRYAERVGIEVWQPPTLKDPDLQARLHALEPDVMVVAAYGLLLPDVVLQVPRAGCVNVHASLLPRWRGAAPIQAAILAGDRTTGISLMQMDVGLDTGPVYVRSELPIADGATAGDVHDALAALGGTLLVSHLEAILSGELAAEVQDEAAASYAAKIETSAARLHWRRSAEELARAVRAYNPVPGARFDFADESVKVWQARWRPGPGVADPGTVLALDKDGIEVACGDGSLLLQSLQRPGRKAVTAREFAAQKDLSIGTRFS